MEVQQNLEFVKSKSEYYLRTLAYLREDFFDGVFAVR